MEKSLFEQMGGTYTQVGDYLIPNLRLPEQQDQPEWVVQMNNVCYRAREIVDSKLIY